MFKGLEGEVSALLNEITELSYFMRGAISYDSMMSKTYIERQVINSFLVTRLETESNKMNPIY